MVKAQCQICHDCFKLEKFLFLHCGHGFCPECSKQTESQTVCAICRTPKGHIKPRQIYITLVESNVEKATQLVQSLERIDMNSRAKDLEQKPKKIQKILKTIRAEEEVARILLDASLDLEKRIHPLFAKLEDERKEKDVVTKKLAEKTQKLKTLEIEIKRLREEVRAARKDYDDLAPVADQAKDRWVREKAENTKLSKTVKKQQEWLKGRDEENRVLQASIEDRTKQVKLLRTKLKALASQTKSSKHRLEDGQDESLLVERPSGYLTAPVHLSDNKPTVTPKKRRRLAAPVDTSRHA